MSDGQKVWVDGTLVDYDQANIHVLSHAVQRGSAVFDVLRIYPLPDGPSAFGLRSHAARFDRSMNLMGMEPALSIAEIESAVADVVAANPGSNLVKLVATWATQPTGTLPDTPVPVITIAALTATMNAAATVTPVRARTATMPKIPAAVLPPGLKVAAAYTPGIRQKMRAVANGFNEIVLRTEDGHLAEAVSQSLFVILNDGVLLPPLDVVLDGITRQMMLDVINHLGLRAEIRSVAWDEVERADELFLCSTTDPVLPLSCLDERELVAPGPITQRLATTSAEVFTGGHPLSGRWLARLG